MNSLVALSLAASLSLAMYGQQNSYAGHGYAHYGLAGARDNFNTVYTAGVGGEGFVYKGLAAGASFEILSAYRNFGGTGGLFSPTASWHFFNRQQPPKLVPFVSGGYSLVFNTRGFANGGNFGGGITWWFKPKFGLRTEFRDHVIEGEHLYVFRFGLSFR